MLTPSNLLRWLPYPLVATSPTHGATSVLAYNAGMLLEFHKVINPFAWLMCIQVIHRLVHIYSARSTPYKRIDIVTVNGSNAHHKFQRLKADLISNASSIASRPQIIIGQTDQLQGNYRLDHAPKLSCWVAPRPQLFSSVLNLRRQSRGRDQQLHICHSTVFKIIRCQEFAFVGVSNFYSCTRHISCSRISVLQLILLKLSFNPKDMRSFWC